MLIFFLCVGRLSCLDRKGWIVDTIQALNGPVIPLSGDHELGICNTCSIVDRVVDRAREQCKIANVNCIMHVFATRWYSAVSECYIGSSTTGCLCCIAFYISKSQSSKN